MGGIDQVNAMCGIFWSECENTSMPGENGGMDMNSGDMCQLKNGSCVAKDLADMTFPIPPTMSGGGMTGGMGTGGMGTAGMGAAGMGAAGMSTDGMGTGGMPDMTG